MAYDGAEFILYTPPVFEALINPSCESDLLSLICQRPDGNEDEADTISCLPGGWDKTEFITDLPMQCRYYSKIF